LDTRRIKPSITDRVQELLEKMTLDEKIAQLGSAFPDAMMENGRFSPEKANKIMPLGIGHISAMARSSGLTANALTGMANDIQRFLIENTRLGIPAVIHEECLNGFRAKGATIFPQNIGLASTWDTRLIGRITATIRRQMRATGVHQGLAPVLDVARDQRWGRTEETFGEDPFLVAAMGMAYVAGLQGEDPSQGVAATLKHFAGHGLSEGGLNSAPAHIPPRLLRDVYLYPFEKAVKNAGALSVMNAYHEIDGVPCGASAGLLTGILREEWGFGGVVVSDYFAIGQLESYHHICRDTGEAAGIALAAGIDVELPQTNGFARPLKDRVEKGLVPVALIDRAVERVLRFKFQMGIFNSPYVKQNAPIDIDTSDDRSLALEAARKSITLLKNNKNLLPLDKNIKSIAVIGPNAYSQRNILGDYTFPSGAGYEFETNQTTGQPEVVWNDTSYQTGKIEHPKIVTFLEGIDKVVSPDTKVLYAKGCEVTSANRDGFAEAVQAAQKAEVTVMVMGGMSGLLPECTSGEMRDSLSLGLPGVQADLVKAISDTGRPLVLVLVSGRVHALGWMAEDVDAIVEAWLPGEEGGTAVAEVLFGDHNPGGKLPVSLPAVAGQVPVYYGHKPSGGRSSIWGDYYDGPAKPRFPFGHGLSYTTFAYSNLRIDPPETGVTGEIHISLDVTNTGKRAGEEVVQLYVNDVVASITRPVQELKGFQRISLKVGEQATVEFKLAAADLSFWGRDMNRIVEAGKFRVMVGSSSEDIRLTGEFTII
jgi:beta-glucosidase